MPPKISKRIFALLFVAALAGAIFAIKKITDSGDEFHFHPQLKIVSVTLEDRGGNNFNLYSNLQIINDLAVEARVRELEYQVFYDNDMVLQSLFKKDFIIKKSDTTVIMLPMKIDKSDLNKLNRKFVDYTSDSAKFKLKAFFRLDVPIAGYRQFEVTRDLTLPVFRILEVESRKITLEKFSLRHPELDVELTLKNPNSFPITLRNCTLDLEISDDLKLQGHSKGVYHLGPHQSKAILLHAKVLDMNPVKVAWKSLVKDDKTPFKSKLSFKVISKNPLIDKSNFVILKDGTLDEIKK